MIRKCSLAVWLIVLAGCRPAAPVAAVPVAATGASAPARPTALPVVAELPPRPEPGPVNAFLPPVAEQSSMPSGATVWLVGQHKVPLVAVALVFPGAGSASDPPREYGRAYLAARVLGQGGAGMPAAAFHAALADLGAEFAVETYVDYMQFSLLVPREKLPQALALAAGAALAPNLDATEFERENALWRDMLLSRESDPQALFEDTNLCLLYGPTHPYGHAKSGELGATRVVTVQSLKRFATQQLRAANLTVVAAGDISMPGLTTVLAGVGLARPAAKALPASAPPLAPPLLAQSWAQPGRVYYVEKPEAAQAVVGLVAPGLAGTQPESAAALRANTILGGSFTSRLNQELRETRGLTYGASSQFGFRRATAPFSALASVENGKAVAGAEALVELVRSFAQEGPTDSETEKSRLIARGALIETYESVASTASRLARVAGIGARPGFDRESSVLRDAAGRAELKQIAATYMHPDAGFLVVVGPPTLASSFERTNLGPLVRVPTLRSAAFLRLARSSAPPASPKP
jgi:zinc protease